MASLSGPVQAGKAWAKVFVVGIFRRGSCRVCRSERACRRMARCSSGPEALTHWTTQRISASAASGCQLVALVLAWQAVVRRSAAAEQTAGRGRLSAPVRRRRRRPAGAADEWPCSHFGSVGYGRRRRRPPVRGRRRAWPGNWPPAPAAGWTRVRAGRGRWAVLLLLRSARIAARRAPAAPRRTWRSSSPVHFGDCPGGFDGVGVAQVQQCPVWQCRGRRGRRRSQKRRAGPRARRPAGPGRRWWAPGPIGSVGWA